VAGVFDWPAGGGRCAKRGKLAKANRAVTSAVRVFIKNPPSVPTLRHPQVPRGGHEVPDTSQVSCQTRELRADSPKGLTQNRLTMGSTR
jgi:hypothetical protein